LNPSKRLTTIALCAAIVPALLAACGGEEAATGTTAQQQFLEERMGTPDPSYTPGPRGGVQFMAGPDGAGRMPGIVGTVEKVDGRNLTVKNPMTGEESTVHLSDGAAITTQAEATLADLKVGDNINAIGALEGEVLTANLLQIGGGEPGAMIMNAPIRPGGPGGPGGGSADEPVQVPFPGTGGSQSPRPGMMSEVDMVAGTVEKIDSQAVTVRTPEDKSVTVRITGDTRLQKQAAMGLSELETGMTVIATGEQQGEVFEATAVRVATAMQVARP
jgi:hypothetical protein